jgi:hypothetical protein
MACIAVGALVLMFLGCVSFVSIDFASSRFRHHDLFAFLIEVVHLWGFIRFRRGTNVLVKEKSKRKKKIWITSYKKNYIYW